MFLNKNNYFKIFNVLLFPFLKSEVLYIYFTKVLNEKLISNGR